MDLQGIFPPIATPFLGDDLDLRGLSANIARWGRTGLSGLVVLGSNGEAPLIDLAEAERLVAAARADLPRDKSLMAGTGQQSTAQTIKATRNAARAGADAALVLNPFYYKGQMTADALVRHFTAVADASPIPIVLYNMPGVTGLSIPIAAVQTLAEHPQIIGIKDSSGDAAYVADLVSQTPSSFRVVVGVAPNLYAALCLGARGGVVAIASIFPELCVKLPALVRAGQHAEALALQRAITPLARAVTSTYGVPGLKAALDATGYVGGAPRSPLQPLAAPQVQEIRQMVERLQAWADAQPALDPQLA